MKNTTATVLQKMLTENTGRHMLDSGGAYGRHWERNQGRKFKDEPEVKLEFGKHGVEVTVSLFHFLNRCLEYDPQMQRRFDNFCKRKANRNESWFSNAEDFIKEIEGEIVEVVNTYNHDSLLSQVIQYYKWEEGENVYVLLSIHGGCDIRGGYTKPRCFVADYYYLMSDYTLAISCAGLDPEHKQQSLPHVKDIPSTFHCWDTHDAGYHWERQEINSTTRLEDYELTDNEEEKGKDKIYYDENNNGYCPICGAKLEAYLDS